MVSEKKTIAEKSDLAQLIAAIPAGTGAFPAFVVALRILIGSFLGGDNSHLG